MAISTTVTYRSGDVVEMDLTATADADVNTGNIPHGLGPARPLCFLTPILPYPLGGGSNTGAIWTINTLNGTNLVLVKQDTTGSGNASPQLRITLMRRR